MALITTVGAHNADSYATLAEANAYIANRPDSKNWSNIDYLERERVLKQAAIDIDVLRFRGDVLLNSDGGKYYAPQKLQFPRTWCEYYYRFATGGSTSTLIDTWLLNVRRPNDYFKYGSILIVEGTNVGEIREVASSVYTTSTITVSSDFSSAIDTTSRYMLIEPVPDYIKWAQCEQALYLTNHVETTSKYNEFKGAGIESISIGDVAVKFGSTGNRFTDKVGGIISVSAFKYIRRYLDTNTKSGRA